MNLWQIFTPTPFLKRNLYLKTNAKKVRHNVIELYVCVRTKETSDTTKEIIFLPYAIFFFSFKTILAFTGFPYKSHT